MKLPPFNVLLGLIPVGFAVYHPMVTVNTPEVMLKDTGPAWTLFIWGGICLLLGFYGRKSREYIGPVALIALTPFFKKAMIDASLQDLRIKGAMASYGLGAYLAWAGALVILFAAYRSVSSDPQDKADGAS
jgi:hypothetical protein